MAEQTSLALDAGTVRTEWGVRRGGRIHQVANRRHATDSIAATIDLDRARGHRPEVVRRTVTTYSTEWEAADG